MLEKIRNAYYKFLTEYDRRPNAVFMSESAYKKAKDEAGVFMELPDPFVASLYGAAINVIEVPGDVVFFGILAIGPIKIT